MNERLAYVSGGACGLLIGIGYVIIIGLFVPIGAPPTGTDSLLPYLATNETRWWWIIGLSVLTDFLFIPLAASMWSVLRKASLYLVGLAVTCVMLFVFLDLAITWPNYVAAMGLAGRYTKAVPDIQKSAILAAAEPVAVVLHSKLLFVYNSLTLAVGILLTSIAMLRIIFSRAIAYVGIAAGSAGVLAVVGPLFISALGNAIILASCLTTVWVFALGCKLCCRGIAIRSSSHT